jgi:hypothetical protein
MAAFFHLYIYGKPFQMHTGISALLFVVENQ